MAASLLPTGDEKEIITYYFSRGYEYDAIVHFLAKFHDITMSIRTLKNRLRRYQLRRRTPTYDLNLVREAILRELSGPGCSGGYRSMWHTLHLHNIQVPRHVVENLMFLCSPFHLQWIKVKLPLLTGQPGCSQNMEAKLSRGEGCLG